MPPGDTVRWGWSFQFSVFTDWVACWCMASSLFTLNWYVRRDLPNLDQNVAPHLMDLWGMSCFKVFDATLPFYLIICSSITMNCSRYATDPDRPLKRLINGLNLFVASTWGILSLRWSAHRGWPTRSVPGVTRQEEVRPTCGRPIVWLQRQPNQWWIKQKS